MCTILFTMIEGEQGECTPMERVLSCLTRREVNTKFPSYLRAFIKGCPSKQEVQEVAKAFLKSKKEGLHYRDLIDLLIVILKLLLNFARNEQEENLEERFNEKFKLFQQKLKKPQVDAWILALRDELAKTIVQKGEMKNLKDLYEKNINLDLNSDKIKLERNESVKAFKKIALQFFECSEVERRTGEPDFYTTVTNSIRKMKVDMKEMEDNLKKQKKIVDELRQISKRHGIKDINSEEIVDLFDKHINQVNSKLSFLNKRLEDSKIVEKEKDERIANLRIRLEKTYDEIKVLKNRVQQLQNKEEEMICKNFLSNSEVILPNHFKLISFIRNSIKEITHIDGDRCSLLFASKQPKSKNFHEFIDNKPNILLLVLLKNGTIIGGFSQEQFRPRCSGQNGFIFNVSQLEAYQRQQRSTISYDDYYLIFGNSEICIKVNDMHMLSNFGIQARHFDSKNRDVSFFLDNNHREIQMEAYEIYQVLTE